MGFTESELAALRRAYASGVLEVRYDGTLTRYDSGEALLARIRTVEAALAAQAAGGSRSLSRLTTFGRGE